MSEQTPEPPEGDDDREIAEEAKKVDDPAHNPATGYGGVIDTSQHVEKDEAEPDTFEPDVPERDN